MKTEYNKVGTFKAAVSGRDCKLGPPDSLEKAWAQVSLDLKTRQRVREHKAGTGIPLAFKFKCHTLA